ncbi:hypothetical protein GEOBRER4_n3275 [Citrifermentans bremense]|uniref:Uncharacterized protein n=1 Tax=Citrifermentans bremense TaxID=60035 RepID=A0A7R7FTS9_9BACT|nr:hypothetical protein GEOBRER4_n3275 [Citrifermentans bremense]
MPLQTQISRPRGGGAKHKELQMFREEIAKIEELAERIDKLRGSL